MSSIVAVDFAWLRNLAQNTFTCVLLLALTYFLWSKWTASVQRQSRSRIASAVESKDSTKSREDDLTLRTRHTILGEEDGNTLNATTRQEKNENPNADDDQTPVAKRKFARADYTVGWICAISTEHVAAQAFLDEEHEWPDDIPNNDDNSYNLGRVGKHNVVIVVLPIGEYGIATAASVAKDLSRSFPNIRIGLMVGIGGGAPSRKHDIRLGDVVVSVPGNGDGGVFQYDFGKTIQGETFHITGYLNQPPTFLRTAVNRLKSQYMSNGHHLEEAISSILEKNPRLREFQRPHASTDRLYQPEVRHPHTGDASCLTCCGDNEKTLVLRRGRTKYDDNPTIHYGLIASANQVMKDAVIRDKLIARKEVLCFEMEAAGLMNQFPCLVVRGICDYADSHKNSEWQGYAAMAAAAYAKDLLLQIPPKAVESGEKLGSILSGLLDTTQKQLAIQQDAMTREESAVQRKCLQLFRLTNSNKDITYEWYKDRIEDRVEGTCQWFLQHPHFLEWLKQDSGPLLVSADPGCGKSVLAKYLVNHGLPRSSTVCYFFFKEQDQNTIRQALCALLHQLFSQKLCLIDHAIPQFHENGEGLVNSTRSLWTILEDAVQDPRAGPVILVLDALDECAEQEFENLVRNVAIQFRSDSSGHSQLKCLLTSRPYEQIVNKFNGLLSVFPNIRIPGEEESETISHEVSHVIKYRIDKLAEERGLPNNIKDRLMDQLLKISHRTYLWVYLVFDSLATKGFANTVTGLDSAVGTLPKTVNDAYEQILGKSTEPLSARKVLCIMLAAARPLTLSEMNVAVHIHETAESIHDLDLETERDFKRSLRRWCGLFISVYRSKIYFLHQTAREFLLVSLSPPTVVAPEMHWHLSITPRQAHTVLAEACVFYLNFYNNSKTGRPPYLLSVSPEDEGIESDAELSTAANGEFKHIINSHAFLDYSATNWGAHFCEADITDDATIIPVTMEIYPRSKSFTVWWERTLIMNTRDLTDLIVSSYYGHLAIVRLLVENFADIEQKDNSFGRTPLLWAAVNGHETIVLLLLHNNANIKVEDRRGQTALSLATEKGHDSVVRLLLEKGADIEAKVNGMTTLVLAALKGHEAIVRHLLEKGANMEAKDDNGRTALVLAIKHEHEAIIRHLLDNGANKEAKDNNGQTALVLAVNLEHEAIVRHLLDNGADIEAKAKNGITALLLAAYEGYETIFRLLLERGADIEAKSDHGQTPLVLATRKGHEAIVRHLLEKGADIEAQDKQRLTPLLWAAINGYEATFRLLVDNGADIEANSDLGLTPLSCAASMGHEAIIRLLLDNGADIEAKSDHGLTPLSCAASMGREVAVRLLLEKGDACTEDCISRSPLSHAARSGDGAIVMALLRHHSVKPDHKDYYGSTPLSIAVRNCHIKIVKLLLATGQVTLDPDRFGRTLWWWARECGSTSIEQALIDYAEKKAITFCESDSESDWGSDISSLVADVPSPRCDVCTLDMPQHQVSYGCNLCCGGDFDICLKCYDIGARCLRDDHELVQRDGDKHSI